MDVLEQTGVPAVTLGYLGDDSVAASVYVLVRHGVQQRPDLAIALRGSVRMRFSEGYCPLRIDFRGRDIEVADEYDDGDRDVDLELGGRLSDISALIAAPLVGGVPTPTSPHGRRAIARLADGRVSLDGSLLLARGLLRLLSVDARAPLRA